jgi:hypothetical protein
MTKSDPWHNSYECPVCDEWVPIALPMAAYATCPGCKRKLKVMVDAEFDENGWHDRTELDFADEPDPDREHKERMLRHGLDWIAKNVGGTDATS